MRRLLLACTVLLLVAFAGLAGGSAPFGRVALSFGLPKLAAPLLRDPLWRGVAHYRAGAFAQQTEPTGDYRLLRKTSSAATAITCTSSSTGTSIPPRSTDTSTDP